MGTALARREEGNKLSLRALINPIPKQETFFRVADTTKFTLYGGARGGGKSFILRWYAIRMLLRWAALGFEAVRFGIFCETFPTLKDRQLSRAYAGRREDRYPDWLGTWNLADHEFRLYPRYGGGIVMFRNLDDPAKYLSAEFGGIAVDELTRNPLPTFNMLRGSLRWPGIAHTPFVAGSNPTGIGHAWVKDVFIDKTFELDDTKNLVALNPRTGRRPYRPEDFGYVKSLPTDNPHNSPEYLAELESLPDRLRAAFFEGNWDVFEGQAFDEWNASVHISKSDIRHLRGWTWIAVMDWGWRKGAIYLVAVGPEGDMEVVHEIVFARIHAFDAAKEFGRRWDNLGQRPEAIIADEQMWQDASSKFKGAQTLAAEFYQGLLEYYGDESATPKLVKGAHGPGSRKIKFNLMHRYLKYKVGANGVVPPWGRPLLRVQARCKYLIRTLPALPVDPDKPEDDVDTTSPDDHGYDAICFALTANVPKPESEDDFRRADQHPGIDVKKRRRVKKPKATEVLLGLPDADEPGPYEMPRLGGALEEVTD